MSIDATYFTAEPTRVYGRITDISIQPITMTDEDGNEQLVDRIVVTIQDEINGIARYLYFKPSRNARSKWIKWLQRIEQRTGIKPRDASDLLNRYFEFEELEFSWGPDITVTLLVPVREFESKEEMLAFAQAKEAGATEVVTLETAGGREQYIEDLITSLANGRTFQEFIQEALQQPDIAEDAELVQQLVAPGHPYLERLVQEGKLTKVGDRYVAVEG